MYNIYAIYIQCSTTDTFGRELSETLLKHTFQTLTRFCNERMFNSGIFPKNNDNFLTRVSSYTTSQIMYACV